MISPLDRLDLAAYSLTRVAAFTDRTPPSGSEIGTWLARKNPDWRAGRQNHDSLADHCERAGKLPYGLSNLFEATSELLALTEYGWRLSGGGPVNTVVRWRMPLGTVHAAAAAQMEREKIGAPPTAMASIDFDARLLQEGAVDSHVHLGTCLPFDGLFELLQARSRDSAATYREILEANSGDAHDSAGLNFNLSHAVGTGAILSSLFDRFLADRSEDFEEFVTVLPYPQSFKAAIFEGTLWEFLLAEEEGQIDPALRIASGHRFISPVRGQQDEHDPYRVAANRKLKLLRKAFEDDSPLSFLWCLEDLLRADALVHTVLTQGKEKGLDAFISSSQRLSHLRSPLPEQSKAVIRYGLPYLVQGIRLRGIELRTAEQFAEHEGVEHLAESIDSKLGGYKEALERIPEQRPVATFPICLIKEKDAVTPAEAPASIVEGHIRFDIQPLFSLVTYTADLLARFPKARQVMPGLDVAGEENAVPNWCFGLLFRVFLARVEEGALPEDTAGPLAFRVHAGEDFQSPLQGLRRIYESARWVVPDRYTPRIGHGLALSALTPGPSAHKLQLQPVDEAFDDLVWAWSLLEEDPGGGHRRLIRILEEVITTFGSQLYGIEEAEVADYCRAYRKRFELSALKRLGFLVPSTGGGRFVVSERAQLPSRPRPDETILYRYLCDQKLGVACEEQPLDPAWFTQVVDAVRPLTLQAVRARSCVIESCPTSNLIIAGIDDYKRHPIHEWMDQGLEVTINTDDPGLFSISLQDEFAHIWGSSDPADRAHRLQQTLQRSLDMMPSSISPRDPIAVIDELREEFAVAGMSSSAR